MTKRKKGGKGSSSIDAEDAGDPISDTDKVQNQDSQQKPDVRRSTRLQSLRVPDRNNSSKPKVKSQPVIKKRSSKEEHVAGETIKRRNLEHKLNNLVAAVKEFKSLIAQDSGKPVDDQDVLKKIENLEKANKELLEKMESAKATLAKYKEDLPQILKQSSCHNDKNDNNRKNEETKD